MDRFRKIAKLAEGGFGETFRDWDDEGDVPVVLKQPLAKHIPRHDLLERCDREITRLVTLSHPHVVPIVDHGQDERGIPFIAMHFLPGGSLADRNRPSPPTSLHRWSPAIAQALDYIHAERVVRRYKQARRIQLAFERGGQ